jgi:protein TonB
LTIELIEIVCRRGLPGRRAPAPAFACGIAHHTELALDYVEDRFSAHRLVGIAFVVLLHIVIIYALVNGLGEQFVQVLHQPLEAKIIQEVKPPPVQPPPPPPQLVQPPPPFIPPPLVQIAQPPPPVPVIAQVTHVQPAAPPPRPVPQQPAIRSAAGLDPNQTCTPPQYPEDAEDMEQTGTTIMQFLIGTGGEVVSSRVAISSGHESLDDAAIRALTQCKFKPAIGSDGKPQEAWTSIRYVWQLN